MKVLSAQWLPSSFARRKMSPSLNPSRGGSTKHDSRDSRIAIGSSAGLISQALQVANINAGNCMLKRAKCKPSGTHQWRRVTHILAECHRFIPGGFKQSTARLLSTALSAEKELTIQEFTEGFGLVILLLTKAARPSKRCASASSQSWQA